MPSTATWLRRSSSTCRPPTRPCARCSCGCWVGRWPRVPADATAFAHRASRIMVNLAAIYQGPADRAVREAWVADFAAALRQGDSGAYVNFLGDEGQARVRQAYPGSTWERPAAIKARYDPTNLFRRNQNIPPAIKGPGQ